MDECLTMSALLVSVRQVLLPLLNNFQRKTLDLHGSVSQNYLVSIFSAFRVNNFDEGVKQLPDS